VSVQGNEIAPPVCIYYQSSLAPQLLLIFITSLVYHTKQEPWLGIMIKQNKRLIFSTKRESWSVACILLHQVASTSYGEDVNAVNTAAHRLWHLLHTRNLFFYHSDQLVWYTPQKTHHSQWKVSDRTNASPRATG